MCNLYSITTNQAAIAALFGVVNRSDLPNWDWQDISAHLKCTKCGTVGYVDTRLDWTEVINFNKGIDGRSFRRWAK